MTKLQFDNSIFEELLELSNEKHQGFDADEIQDCYEYFIRLYNEIIEENKDDEALDEDFTPLSIISDGFYDYFTLCMRFVFDALVYDIRIF